MKFFLVFMHVKLDLSILANPHGESRLWEGFWQLMLHSFMPEGLDVRFLGH